MMQTGQAETVNKVLNVQLNHIFNYYDTCSIQVLYKALSLQTQVLPFGRYLEESPPVRPIDQMNVSHADDQVSNPGKSSEMPVQLPVLNDYLTCRQPGIIPRQYSSEMLTQLPVFKPDSLNAYLGQTIFSLPFPVRST